MRGLKKPQNCLAAISGAEEKEGGKKSHFLQTREMKR